MFLVHQLQLIQERLVFDAEGYCDENLIRPSARELIPRSGGISGWLMS